MATDSKLLLEAIASKGYDETYSQILHESLDETKDVSRAIKVANSVYSKQPKKKQVPEKEPRNGTQIIRVQPAQVHIDAPKITVPAPQIKVESPTIKMETPVINVPAPQITVEAPVFNMLEEKEKPKRKFEVVHSDGKKTIITEL